MDVCGDHYEAGVVRPAKRERERTMNSLVLSPYKENIHANEVGIDFCARFKDKSEPI